MNQLKRLLTVLAIAMLATVSQAHAQISPLHNPINGLDVDDNARIQARDALLVISVLLQPNTLGTPATALAETISPSYYWDTSDDGRVSPRDALLVISYLTTVPEPNTLLMAGLGLPLLAGYAWRRRRGRKVT